MDVRTRKALQGYISRQPRLTRLPDGVALFIAQLGQKHYRREDDGGFTLVGTSYVKIVMIGEHAETASGLFEEGDDVIALGEFKTRTITAELAGAPRELITAGSTFSPEHLDQGTEILLRKIPEAEGAAAARAMAASEATTARSAWLTWRLPPLRRREDTVARR